MHVSQSRMSTNIRSKTPGIHQSNGRAPISAFMGLAPVVLCGTATACTGILIMILEGLSNKLEEGMNEFASTLSRGGK